MGNCCGQVNFIRRWKMSWCTANKKWNISNLEILNLQSYSENLTYDLSKQMYIDPCLYNKAVFALVLPENPWFSYWIGKLVTANWGSVNTSGGSANTNGGSVKTNGGSVNTNGESVNTNWGAVTRNGRSVNTNGRSVNTNGGSAHTNGGSANTNGGSVKNKWSINEHKWRISEHKWRISKRNFTIIFPLYRERHYYWWRKSDYTEKPIDMSQVDDKLYHLCCFQYASLRSGIELAYISGDRHWLHMKM